MRIRFLLLAASTALLTAGCNSSTGGLYGERSAPAAATQTQARVANWEAQWTEAKQEVTQARAEAAAAGRPIAPELDAEVTELLQRDLQSPDPEVRIERLQDAVSDALRLAELVSIG